MSVQKNVGPFALARLMLNHSSSLQVIERLHNPVNQWSTVRGNQDKYRRLQIPHHRLNLHNLQS